MAFWERATEGELTVDHRASPGLTESDVRKIGYPGDPANFREGALWVTHTKGCKHCHCVVVMRPDRTRPRPHCFKCNHYICDGCAFVASSPDYVHHSFQELADGVVCGKIALIGGSANDPIVHVQGEAHARRWYGPPAPRFVGMQAIIQNPQTR